ncbi:MAG TPA: tetratricopeptide repeat protein [Pseudomonadales bacterium]|nr:tetratricopeptide repeat protein [Pseudomonadales bacterium]
MKRLALAVALFAVAACSDGPKALQDHGPKVGAVLAELPPLGNAPAPAEHVDTAAASAAYHRVEGTLPDASDNRRIDRRLADLDRRLGAETDPQLGAAAYRDAIARYAALLADPQAGDTEYVLYHLAEAYDGLDDHVDVVRTLDRLIAEFPHSEYRVEARFRRGELAFSANDYTRAAADYGYVVEQGPSSPYWQNANYMLGWARFKQGDYDRSLDAFLATIDSILADGPNPPRAMQEMLDDTLRAVVLASTSLDGAATLTAHFGRMHKPTWQYRAYSRLAEDLQAKQRIQDSVAALEEFVRQNPYDAHSVEFAKREIETLSGGNFPTEARKHKEAFVTRYAFASDYWVVVGNDAREQWAPTLKTYLLEVAKLAHRDGQQQKQTQMLLTAAKDYGQFVDTFPHDPACGEVLFLEGDALTDAHEPARALVAYQRVVHEHRDDPHAPDAGYAAIVTLDALVNAAEPNHVELLIRRRIDAQIEYATLFPTAAHAAEMQAAAAHALFERHEYPEATQLAEALLQRGDALPQRTAFTATMIVAQADFDAQRFADAESNYRKALALGQGEAEADAKEAASIRARLAASIYKQAEAHDKRGDVDAAVHDYLRIAADDPRSDVAAQGQYDAVAAYEAAQRWGDAADLLEATRARYPNKSSATDLDRRLADLYEKANRPGAAAAAFERVAAANNGTEVGRAALYHAGELYANDPQRAADCFRRYIAAYPTPVDQTLEAAHRLQEIAAAAGAAAERDRWLHEQVDLVDASGASSDRAHYLAAAAQFELAEATRRDFDAIGWSGDLKKSLARKERALKQTVAAYEKAASYGVAEFATASTYRTADTYATLARELIGSPRPSNLSDLEREQYDVLLEEQASPIEQLAISIHEINVHRSWKGEYDAWVQRSLDALRTLYPARYARVGVDVLIAETLR